MSDYLVRRNLLHGDRLLSTGEVAALFSVDPKTVTRWARTGRFPTAPDGKPSVIRGPGKGHRRYRDSVIRGLLEGTLQWGGDDGDD